MSSSKDQKQYNPQKQSNDKIFSRTLKYCDRSSTLHNYQSNKSQAAKSALDKHIQSLKNIEKCLQYVQRESQVLDSLKQFKELPQKLKQTQLTLRSFASQTFEINQSLKQIQNNNPDQLKHPSNTLFRSLNHTHNHMQNISHQILVLQQKTKKFVDQKSSFLNKQVQSFLENIQKKIDFQKTELNLNVIETRKQLHDYRTISSINSINKVKQFISQQFNAQKSLISQFYSDLGLLRCQVQSTKDKKRKIRVQELLQQREKQINDRHGKRFLNKIDRSSLLTDAQLLLAIQQLQDFLNRNNQTIQKQTNILTQSLQRLRSSQKYMTISDRQRQLEFYRIYERIKKTNIRIKAVKKKTLIEIKKIESIKTEDSQIKGLIESLNVLINRSIKHSWKKCQERLFNALQN